MKYLIVSIFFSSIIFSSFAQQQIKLEDIKNHVGDSVKIMAKIYGGKYIKSAKGSPTFLNVGDNYPNAPLTVVIWSNVRSQFKTPPEELFKQRAVFIYGKITLYKDKPEITIYNPNQLIQVAAAPVEK